VTATWFSHACHESEASFAAEAVVDRTRPLNHQNYARSEGDLLTHPNYTHYKVSTIRFAPKATDAQTTCHSAVLVKGVVDTILTGR
jgi:hypothetical protein